MKTVKILSLVIITSITFLVMSCKTSQEPSKVYPQIDTVYIPADTVYLDSLITDTLWLPQLQEDNYFWLYCDGINGLDTLAHLWLKRVEPSDTNSCGWEMLYFSADPESSIYNAIDFFITHAPPHEGY